MPYGVTWSHYFKTLLSGFVAMSVGSQIVHLWYSPDLTIPEVPPKKGELHTKLYTRRSLVYKDDFESTNGSNTK